ncbi:FecR family protein [Leptospira idonii]|uniref:Iron dicitrate transport regulator FecR n=1 Tax=Leptospira idonii TaxID=1193500 RepID=A0A4R9LYY4_9LEPT|nr:FecR family protein [Leptospira idonii]TGN19604.1 iron dicitrate transport regulator FecR [Leptospira idonii]
MNENFDSEKLRSLEERLAKPAKATLQQSFPSWEEISKKQMKYEDVPPPSAKPKVISFPYRIPVAVGAAVLAAASLFFVFLPAQKEMPSGEEVAGKKGNLPAPIYDILKGTVLAVQGNNFVLPVGGTDKKPLQKGQSIAEGDQILTASNGSVDIDFENKTWIRIAGGSEIEIGEIKKSNSSSRQILKVAKGKLLAMIGKLKKDSLFQIASGDVETTVRGTTFSVSYDGSQSIVAVKEGEVEVKRMETAAETSIINADHQLTVPQTKIEGNPQILPLEKKTFKELESMQIQITRNLENLLYQEFSRLELVRLENGKELRGVILGQTDSHIQLQTAEEGIIEIPISEVLETEKIR